MDTEDSSTSATQADGDPRDGEKLLAEPMADKCAVNADSVLDEIGARNPYVVAVFAMMSLLWALSAMPMMASAFMMGSVCTAGNASECSGTHDTIAGEFEVDASQSYLVDLTASAFLLGSAIGGTVLSRLSDIYGRRPILILTLALFGGTGVLSSVAPNIYALLALRFAQGFPFTSLIFINWVLAYESAPKNLRVHAALTFGLFWVLGYCIVAPLAYYFPNWRHLIAIVSAPSLICAVAFYFILPESLHFLVSKKRHSEVLDWLRKARKFDSAKQMPEIDVDALLAQSGVIRKALKNDTASKDGLIHDLLRSRTLLMYTVVMAYLWACATFVYYGLSLFSTQLAGDHFVNYVLSGVVELPCYLTIPFMLDRLGRRLFVALSYLITCVCLLLTIFSGQGSTLTLCLWLIGKFSISWAFTSIRSYASELFPTVYRSSCIGICEMIARFGGVFAPLTRTLGALFPALPIVLISTMSAIAFLATLLLPETKGRDLPDTISDIGPKKSKKPESSENNNCRV
ncbi:sugar transporter [Aphelenchoides avenae]|nr:sugar transporter [Aphelenchus avenae]